MKIYNRTAKYMLKNIHDRLLHISTTLSCWRARIDMKAYTVKLTISQSKKATDKFYENILGSKIKWPSYAATAISLKCQEMKTKYTPKYNNANKIVFQFISFDWSWPYSRYILSTTKSQKNSRNTMNWLKNKTEIIDLCLIWYLQNNSRLHYWKTVQRVIK